MNGKKYILIIDDDDDVRETLVDVIVSLGLTAHSAVNGEHALEVIREIGVPALIFLDGMMPVMNGPEFYAHYRKLPGHEAVPVVLFSALGDKFPLEGLSGVLKKPAELDEIIRYVELHCGMV